MSHKRAIDLSQVPNLMMSIKNSEYCNVLKKWLKQWKYLISEFYKNDAKHDQSNGIRGQKFVKLLKKSA